MNQPTVPNVFQDAPEQRLGEETDRTCVLLGAALLQEQLGELLRARLNGDHENLLRPDGHLGAYRTRVQLIHGLSWITDVLRDDLLEVRNIHDEMSLNDERPFANAIAVERCAALRTASTHLAGSRADLVVHDGMSVASPDVDEKVENLARSFFMGTVQKLVMELRERVGGA